MHAHTLYIQHNLLSSDVAIPLPTVPVEISILAVDVGRAPVGTSGESSVVVVLQLSVFKGANVHGTLLVIPPLLY